jgi:hypothetical protein
MSLTRIILAWIPMAFLAILNGTLRESTYGKRLHELRAHQVSTVMGMGLFGIYIGLISRIWQTQSVPQALTVGLIWLVLTVCFEFIFGHFVARHSWQRLLRDYNLLAGRLWILILAWITLAPLAFHHLANR